MSKIVVTLLGPQNEVAKRIHIKLEGLEDKTVLPDVQLIELDVPVLVLGVQINGVPDDN